MGSLTELGHEHAFASTPMTRDDNVRGVAQACRCGFMEPDSFTPEAIAVPGRPFCFMCGPAVPATHEGSSTKADGLGDRHFACAGHVQIHWHNVKPLALTPEVKSGVQP